MRSHTIHPTLLASLIFCSCNDSEKTGSVASQQETKPETQTTYLSEEGQQNLAKFSHGEEPYLSLIRTTQLLDHLRIKGWSLRHITQHEYTVYLVSDSKKTLMHSGRIEKRSYPYLFMSLSNGLEIVEVSNTRSSSASIGTKVPSGRYRTDPIPNELGSHNLFTSYDKKHRVDIVFSSGE